MSTDEKMTLDERRKYLRMMRKRYGAAKSKRERGQLLDEMQAISGLDRKVLIRLMKGPLARRQRRRQRGKRYGPEVDHALGLIAESLDYVCAERLTPKLVWMAEQLARHGELDSTPELLAQLGSISLSSVRRHLEAVVRDRPRLVRQPPGAANPLARTIPMRRIPWDEPEPGHFEVDTVHHCGASASGDYVHTLQLIDVATGWSERVAVLGRSYLVMQAGFEHCLARLLFAIRELHPDNGSEFLNQHLLRFFGAKVVGASLSRSRPYHKNDNRKVEQKNGSLVRSFLGYDRFDTVAHTQLLNVFYDRMWLYYNFFQPVLHLVAKETSSLPGQPPRIRRHHDDAQTPFDRLCATQALSDDQRVQWQAVRDRTNPRQLRQTIYALLDQLATLPGAVPGITQDVHQTLPIPFSLTKGADALVTLSFDRTSPIR
jgi:hypothetical protein